MDHHDIVELLEDPDFCKDFVFIATATTRLENGKLIELDQAHDVTGVIQPANANDTRVLEQGDQSKRSIKIYLAKKVLAATKTPPKLGDKIKDNGLYYRVASYQDWTQYGYSKAVAVEIVNNG